MLFTGEYEHTIDSKQRLAIPAEVRSRLDAKVHGDSLYIVPGANGALWLWPERTFERMANAMEQSLVPGAEMMEFEELMFPQSRRLEIDSAGRVRIPEQMLSEFGLGQTIIILGMKDHLELRDPESWRAQREQSLAKRQEIMMRARQALRQQNQSTNGGGGFNSGGEKERP